MTAGMKTILFADDRRNIREYCRAALEDEGYRVVLACDGVDALRVFFEESPDLAILDISMPRMNGLEALERISSIAPQVPVVLFTAHVEDCLRDRRASLAAACVEKDEDLSDVETGDCRLADGTEFSGSPERDSSGAAASPCQCAAMRIRVPCYRLRDSLDPPYQNQAKELEG